MKATLTSISKTLGGEYLITLQTRDPAAVDAWNELREHPVRVEMKQWRDKRSLSANAYAWVLIDKLAEALGRTKAEIYREAIRDIGGVSSAVCVPEKAVDSLREGWTHNGIGWFSEVMDRKSKVKDCVNVVLYYGSSTYDTRQMNHLIDKLVQDCKAVGIETLTPNEIAAMNAAWG